MALTSEDLTKALPWVLARVDEGSIDEIMEKRNYVKQEMMDYLLENKILKFSEVLINVNDMLALAKLGLFRTVVDLFWRVGT